MGVSATTDQDAIHEARIDAAYERLCATKDRDVRVVAWEDMRALINGRSGEQVARMEEGQKLKRRSS